MSGTAAAKKALSQEEYRQIAQFRYEIGRFLHFSEEAARLVGLEPRQHQLMLAIKGLPDGARPTIGVLSERLCLRPHSTVELTDRLVARGAIVRRHCPDDRREVLLHLTPEGQKILRRLSLLHWEELQSAGPALSRSLQTIANHEI